MRSYIIRRLLSFLPTFFLLVLVSFILLRASPGDPVERMMSSGQLDESLPSMQELKAGERTYWTHQLGLDLPLFYFSIHPLQPASDELSWKNYFPSVSLHSHNQFHRWLFGDGATCAGILRGDFGNSYVTKQPVMNLISDRFFWSLFFTLTSVFLAYLFSIPAGMKAAASPGSAFDKSTSFLLGFLYSLPVFWVATLLLMTLSNPSVMALFPSSGVGPLQGFQAGSSWLQKLGATLPYLILPTIAYTYGSLAFLTGTVRATMIENLGQDYIRTARAKGLSEKTILWKHALRNSLLPLITVFSTVFPVALGGSVILESIFTIPGMGLTIYQSIDAKDYPVTIAVFAFSGLITMLGFLLSDILYSLADPRITFETKPEA